MTRAELDAWHHLSSRQRLTHRWREGRWRGIGRELWPPLWLLGRTRR